MNRYAYRTAGYAVGAISSLAKANFRIHGGENIPKGALIFAVNHFTRIETIFLPYFLNRMTSKTIWSLADYSLFMGGFGRILEKLGALSSRNPDRDKLIVKTLLTGEAAWIIFPEGRMVKNKKVYDAAGKKDARFMILSEGGIHPPHTGAAAIGLRTEFYRGRLRRMRDENPDEAARLMRLFEIENMAPVLNTETFIVPVNITYNPMRGRENAINRLAEMLLGEMPDRVAEEIMMEGNMMLSGVDVDIRFGEPIRVGGYLKSKSVHADMSSHRPIDFDEDIPSRPMLRKTALRIMGRYMSAIYRMTTINHDHILATLLKYYPHMTIDVKDLKRRAYLAAATIDYHKMGVYRHDSLSQNQINLLTDDPKGRIGNFIALAREKGVLADKDGVLVKAFDFEESLDFHQIRIENPIAVAANEIEPLHDLQERLKTIARQHPLRIRYMIRRRLLDKTRFDFEKDYFEHAVPGESKPKHVGTPFLLPEKTPFADKTTGLCSDTGILLVHGYMAAPLEVRALGEHLAARGYRVFAPRLKGHGTAPEDLSGRGHTEWIDAVAEGYGILSNLCSNIVAGGFSFGAGLALDLCTRVDDIKGVFAISAPMKLQDFSTRFIPAIHLWNQMMKKMNLPQAGKQFVNNNPENPHINYLRNPLSAVLEMERLMSALAPRLEKISIPALIIQSFADPVVHYEGAMKIFMRLSSKDKEYLLVNTARHGIINGEGSERIWKAVEQFVEKIDTGVS
ncbi:MAG: alpha/beta fold hydrolase [Desulfosalsimonadaceae bacterium]